MRRPILVSIACSLILISIGQGAERFVTRTIAEGTRGETPCYLIKGKSPGPTVVLTGGVHGNEPAGSMAAEQIRHWPIQRGRLVVIPRVNLSGLKGNSRFVPEVNEQERDLNRDFPKAGGRNQPTGKLATEVWNFVSALKPDWVVDLHEGYGFHQLNSSSVGSSVIDSNSKHADAMAADLLEVVNAEIDQPDHHFVNLTPPVNGSLARAAAEHLGASSLILETTSSDQPLSLRVRQHRTMVWKFLGNLGMVDPNQSPSVRFYESENQLKVAIFDGGGVSARGPAQVEATLSAIPDALVWRVDGQDIREGGLDGFDLVIFPGGSGSKEAADLDEAGRNQVRDFVKSGGGYVGICAGAYLAASNYSWSLSISNHQTYCATLDVAGQGKRSMWYRGESSKVKMELSERGTEILGPHPGVFEVRYHNGPIMSPSDLEGLPNYEVLARFRSEVVRYDPQRGTMQDSPAIISSEFGKGRVLCVSPHPESTEALRPLLLRGMLWASGGQP